MENQEIKIGDYVLLKKQGRKGVVSSIVNYGTHVCYFIDFGGILKFPARIEWIELCEKQHK